MKLFISYAHSNEDSAKELTDLLKESIRADIFIDEELPAGNWEDNLYNKMSFCDVSLLYISKNFIDSLENGYVQKEYSTLFEKWMYEEDFIIIPVQLAPYEIDKKLVLELSKFQWFKPSGKEYNLELDGNNFYFQGLETENNKKLYAKNLSVLIERSYKQRKERKKYKCIRSESLNIEYFLPKIRIHPLIDSFYFHRRYDDELENFLKQGHSVFIFGAPNSGKSTLVYKGLKKLKDKYIIFCKNNTKIFKNDFKKLKMLHDEYGDKLLIYFDDINQYFSNNTVEFIERCRNKNIQIIATCRDGEERNLIYFEEQFYKDINIKALNSHEVKNIKNTLSFLYNFNSTNNNFLRIGSFFNDDIDIQNKYRQLDNENFQAKHLMVCMQILYYFNMYEETSLKMHRCTLKKIFEQYICTKVSDAIYSELLSFLSRKHLIYFDESWVWTEELFLNNFVDNINPFIYRENIKFAEQDPNRHKKLPEIDFLKLVNHTKNINELITIVNYMKESINTYYLNMIFMKITNMTNLYKLVENQYIKQIKPNNHNLQILLNKRSLKSKQILEMAYFNNVKLNVYNFTSLIANSFSIEKAQELLNEMIKLGIEPNQHIYTAMMKKCKNYKCAENYFNKIKCLPDDPNEYAWATLVEATEDYYKAEQMTKRHEFKVSIYALNSLVKKINFNDYNKEQKIINIFNIMINKKIVPDSAILTSFMSRTKKFEFVKSVFDLFNKYSIPYDIQALSVYMKKHQKFSDVREIYEKYIKNILIPDNIKLYSMMLSSASNTEDINYIIEEVRLNKIEKDLRYMQQLYRKLPLNSYSNEFWKTISSTKLRLLINSRYWETEDIEYLCNTGINISKSMISHVLFNRCIYNILKKHLENNFDSLAFIQSMPCFFENKNHILKIIHYVNYPLDKPEQSLKILETIKPINIQSNNEKYNYYRLYGLVAKSLGDKSLYSKEALVYAKNNHERYTIHFNLAKALIQEKTQFDNAIKHALIAFSYTSKDEYRKYIIEDILRGISFQKLSSYTEYTNLEDGLKNSMHRLI